MDHDVEEKLRKLAPVDKRADLSWLFYLSGEGKERQAADELIDIHLFKKAQVAFRYNEINEKRMAAELLDAVHGRISKKGNGLKDKANILKLKGMPMFIANITSHDNKFTESIEDLSVIWEDIENTINTFYCDECKKFISIKNFDNVKNKIRCGCDKLTYDWKK